MRLDKQLIQLDQNQKKKKTLIILHMMVNYLKNIKINSAYHDNRIEKYSCEAFL